MGRMLSSKPSWTLSRGDANPDVRFRSTISLFMATHNLSLEIMFASNGC